jgi:hypothetical protein
VNSQTQPTKAELMARLILCAAILDIRAAANEYKPIFADRASQCRKWIADLQEGRQDEDIIGGLAEFEVLAY